MEATEALRQQDAALAETRAQAELEQARRAAQAALDELQRRVDACTARERPEKPPARQFLLCRGARDDEGLIPKGCVSVLAADGGSGKTRLIMRLAGVLAAQRASTPWVGDFRRRSPIPERVLVILGEEDRDEIARAQWRLARDFPGCLASIDWLSLVESGPMILASKEGAAPACATLAELVRANGYGLVVVDPLVSFHTCDENDNAQMQRIIEALRIVASSGAAVLACHHSPKGARTDGEAVPSADAARGASSLRDGARLLMTLRTRHLQGVGNVHDLGVAKANYSAKGQKWTLVWDPEKGDLVPVEQAPELVRARWEQAERDAEPKPPARTRRQKTNPNGLPRVGG